MVGNWPGVTVERKQGLCRAQGQTLEVVDLPGIYALSTFTLEERIARDYLVSDGPEVIVNLLDAASLSRGLYLTSQLLELGLPVVVALNMMDEARARGDRLDPEALSAALGAPVCPISCLLYTSSKSIDIPPTIPCRSQPVSGENYHILYYSIPEVRHAKDLPQRNLADVRGRGESLRPRSSVGGRPGPRLGLQRAAGRGSDARSLLARCV